MKRLLIIALLLIGYVASATGVVNGDFETAETFVQDTRLRYSADGGGNWRGGWIDFGTQIMTGGGVGGSDFARLQARHDNACCLGQYFSAEGLTAGTFYRLRFSYKVQSDGNRSDDIFTYTVGENDGYKDYNSQYNATSGGLTPEDRMWVADPGDSHTSVLEGVAIDITEEDGTWKTHTSSSFLFDKASDWLFVGFYGDNIHSEGDLDGYLGIDNVEIILGSASEAAPPPKIKPKPKVRPIATVKPAPRRATPAPEVEPAPKPEPLSESEAPLGVVGLGLLVMLLVCRART